MNLKKYLNQKAVYWGNPQNDAWDNTTYDSPVEVDVRWTDKQERFIPSGLSPGGQGTYEEKLSRAMILSETDFDVKGRMMLGELNDLSSDMLPDSNDALTIEAFSKIPDRTANQFLRKTWLI